MPIALPTEKHAHLYHFINVSVLKLITPPLKTLFTLILILFSTLAYAQESQNKSKDPVGGIWCYVGKTVLLFNQTAFSKWATGGINNVSFALDVDYEIHYK